MPLTVEIEPGRARKLSWDTVDFGQRMPNPNFTCALPPGVTINYAVADYVEEIGN